MYVRYESYTYRAQNGIAVPLRPPTIQDSYMPHHGTMECVPEKLHGTQQTIKRTGYTHANTHVSRMGTKIPMGYRRILAVTVRPVNTDPSVTPVTIGYLCDKHDGSRCYRRVSIKNGTFGRETGINRRYQKHIAIDYLAHVAGIDTSLYEIRLKSIKNFTPDNTPNTPESKRIQAVCKSCAGKKKQPVAKPNRKATKPIFLPPERF